MLHELEGYFSQTMHETRIIFKIMKTKTHKYIISSSETCTLSYGKPVTFICGGTRQFLSYNNTIGALYDYKRCDYSLLIPSRTMKYHQNIYDVTY